MSLDLSTREFRYVHFVFECLHLQRGGFCFDVYQATGYFADHEDRNPELGAEISSVTAGENMADGDCQGVGDVRRIRQLR